MNKKILIITFSINSPILQMQSVVNLKENVKIIEVKGTKKEIEKLIKKEASNRYNYIFCDHTLYTKDIKDMVDRQIYSHDMSTKVILHTEVGLKENVFLQVVKNCIEGEKKHMLYRPAGHVGKILADLLKSKKIDYIEIFTEDDDPILFIPNSTFPKKGFPIIKQYLE